MCSCKKQSAPIPSFTNTDLPTHAGDSWTYWYTTRDGANYNTGLVIMKVKFTEIKGNESFIHYIITDTTGFFIDSAVGHMTADSFTYTSVTNQNYFGDFRVPLPCYEGKQWVGIDPRDQYKVLYYSDRYKIAPLDFKKVFSTSSYYWKGDAQRKNDILLSKGVGIIQKNRYEMERDSHTSGWDQTFTLMEYSIQ